MIVQAIVQHTNIHDGLSESKRKMSYMYIKLNQKQVKGKSLT